ncbi:hypothetical protein MIMGU_mgv1a023668mg [Erythranthe guttata]|uniref:Uncharacterized protein n=1 Tax=Erythranthe guttata TaxID=4155 RepID=A0A022RVB5_ERYGU|nr:hypothetical protein MIMGU_mgv1a023668mg [Erythranthe guttata]
MNWLSKIVILSLVFTTANAYSLTNVTVTNELTGDPITVHCYSSNGDEGTTSLTLFGFYWFSFDSDALTEKKFLCSITTQYGSGDYEVWNIYLMNNRCGNNCQWKVHLSGPCVQWKDTLVCQPWQNTN